MVEQPHTAREIEKPPSAMEKFRRQRHESACIREIVDVRELL